MKKLPGKKARKGSIRKIKKAASRLSFEINPRSPRSRELLPWFVRITGPDGLTPREIEPAITTLASVTAMTKSQARSLVQGLISMDIYEITVRVERSVFLVDAVLQLRAAHLLAEAHAS